MVHSLWVFIKAHRGSFGFKPATLLKNDLVQKRFYKFRLEFLLLLITVLSILETVAFLIISQWLLFILNKLQTRLYRSTLLSLVKRVGHFPILAETFPQLHLIIIGE